MDPILEAPDVGSDDVVMVEAPTGLPLVALPTPLTGLHYFDGQAMRDARLTTEQTYRRSLAALAARAGGSGVVSGFDVRPRGGGVGIEIGRGVAIDDGGRVLALRSPRRVSMNDLVSRATTIGAKRTAVELWIVTLSWYQQPGKARGTPVTREGVRVRALPFTVRVPLARSSALPSDPRTTIRSLSASAFFAAEWADGGSLISGDGLRRGTWCGGARWDPGSDVPIAVVAIADERILFIDRWMVCRERHEPPPVRYWAGLMRMRPWSAFVAQILQFQCQLASAGVGRPITRALGCVDVRDTLDATAVYLAHTYSAWQTTGQRLRLEQDQIARGDADALMSAGGMSALELLVRDVDAAKAAVARPITERLLIERGIVELPPAGYLPVIPGKTPTVNAQVRALVGDGVDLRFCIVDPDVIAHELEKGQHMERISLIAGLDAAAQKPRVDVFVPNGRAIDSPLPTAYDTSVISLNPDNTEPLLRGTANRVTLETGGAVLSLAAYGIASAASHDAVWMTARTERPVRTLGLLERTRLIGRVVSVPGDSESRAAVEVTFDGDLAVRSTRRSRRGARIIEAVVDGVMTMARRTSDGVLSDTEEVSSQRVSLAATLRWAGSSSGEMTAMLFSRTHRIARALLTIRKTWDQATGRTTVSVDIPLAVLASLFDDQAGRVAEWTRTRETISIELIENADVLRTDHPLHRLALTAIRDVQTALETETTFTRDALNALFPPTPEHPELLVEAREDWVLFRRRRDASCVAWGDRRTTPVRRARLLMVKAPNRERAASIISSFRKSTLTAPELRRSLAAARDAAAIRVTFPAYGVLPLDDPDVLRAAWKALEPEAAIVGGFIASTRGEGPGLLATRLRSVASQLSPISIVEANAPMIVLRAAPPDLVTFDADGVILFVTTPVG